MQALQRTFQAIAAQLKALSPSARMLIGSLLVIMVMSLFLVSLYAGQADLVPLGLSAASAEARKHAVDYLTVRDIPFEERGNDLLVPAEKKYAILAQLTESQLIDADQINFDTLMSDSSPFRTRDENRQRYLVAKMNVLASMISQMSGVERAKVVLDQPEGAVGLGRSHVPASASVTVQTSGAELGQSQVDAIAHLVARAHAGLKPENVAITDVREGKVRHARSDDVMSAGKYMEVKLDAERHAKTTLQGALDFIPGVLIEVNAQVDTKEVVQTTSKFDEPKIGVTEESNTEKTMSNTAASAEPAVRSNTGASLAASGQRGSQMTDARTETQSVPAFGKSDSRIVDPKGYPLKINASIGIPKSYFVRLFQEAQPEGSAGPPDAAALQTLVDAESIKIRDYITPLIDTGAIEGAAAGTVTVSLIPDFGATLVSNTEMLPSGGGSGGGLMGGNMTDGLVKYISLGGLAVVSLFMMLMMVRKAGVRAQLPTAQELVGIPPALAAAESDLVGEADEASPALEGLELDDDAVRRQQMLEQITDMVSGTPDDAAGLLRRWIKSEG